MLARVVTALTLLFTLPILLIRAQAQVNAPLDILFATPVGCHMPCFLGVSLQQTQWQTALEMLRAHEAVGEAGTQWRNGRLYVVWNWVAEPAGERNFAFLVRGNTADWLVIPDTVTLGEARLALGEPQRIVLIMNRTDPPRAAYVLEYPERDMHIYAGFRPCEMSRNAFWQMQANGDTDGSFFIGVGTPDYVRTLPSRRVELDRHIWAKQIQDLCRQ
jgi:hypothetical protein